MSDADDRKLLTSAHAQHLAGHWVQAEAGYRRLLERSPRHPDAHYNLGLILQDTHRLAEAEAHYQEAISIDPRRSQVWNNLGNLLRCLRRWDQAEQALRKALELKPDHARARLNLALTLLSMGRYTEAWPLYESRLELMPGLLPRLQAPRWRGEPIEGRRLLLVGEQGYGDSIQFIRYAPLLKALGAARITVLCRPALAALLSTCRGVDQFAGQDDGSHDLHIPLPSLPLALNSTLEGVPAHQPYLGVPAARLARWQARLPAGPRVGLVWKGNAGHGNDANRSLDLEALRSLWQVPGVSFVSLQKGAGEAEARQPPEGMPMLALGHEVEDFADLAALVQLVDLVVCVDTAVAHVAGALGRPCWVLLPAVGADWRWFGARGASPWYPRNLRLLDQCGPGNWHATTHGLPARLHSFLGRA